MRQRAPRPLQGAGGWRRLGLRREAVESDLRARRVEGRKKEVMRRESERGEGGGDHEDGFGDFSIEDGAQ